MDWETIKITGMQLTDTEHRYYGDMFTYCCENADTENVPMVNVMNLLSSANLPREVMYKVLINVTLSFVFELSVSLLGPRLLTSCLC